MKKVSVVLCLVLLVLIPACIPSLYPLYTKKDLVKEEKLLGTWKEDNSPKQEGETWQIRLDNDGMSYKLQHTMNGVVVGFKLHYFKLGSKFYFDFYPNEDLVISSKKRKNEFYELHQLPVHTFAKVELKGDEIWVYRFDMDWLEKLFQQRKIRIKHEKVNDAYILTASTRELQTFVKKYANSKDAFMEPIILKKL